MKYVFVLQDGDAEDHEARDKFLCEEIEKIEKEGIEKDTSEDLER